MSDITSTHFLLFLLLYMSYCLMLHDAQLSMIAHLDLCYASSYKI